MNLEIIEKLLIPLVSTVASLLGVWIGSNLSYRSQIKEAHLKMLQDAYAETITVAIQHLNNPSPENLARLLSSCEKTRLLCNEESDAAILELEKISGVQDIDPKVLAQSLSSLRKIARNDIESHAKITNRYPGKKRKQNSK